MTWTLKKKKICVLLKLFSLPKRCECYSSFKMATSFTQSSYLPLVRINFLLFLPVIFSQHLHRSSFHCNCLFNCLSYFTLNYMLEARLFRIHSYASIMPVLVLEYKRPLNIYQTRKDIVIFNIMKLNNLSCLHEHPYVWFIFYSSPVFEAAWLGTSTYISLTGLLSTFSQRDLILNF